MIGETLADRNGVPQAKRLLLVCGVPRSGTTATAQLLNTSPGVVLGVERYSHQLMAAGNAPPDAIRRTVEELFGKDRLFDFREVDNKPFPPSEAEAAKAKYDAAAYVGDKVPRLFLHVEAFAGACPDARFLYVVRDPVGVAASWQARAETRTGNWPAENDYRAGTAMWNASVREAVRVQRAIGWRRLAFVDYGRLFGSPEGAVRQWRAVMDWLGLEAGAPVYRYTRLVLNHSVRRAGRKRRVPGRIRRHVEAVADFDAYEALLQETLPMMVPRNGSE